MMSNNNTTPDSIKRSLILAGGGMRVAYQAGVLMALEEREMKFTHVDGTSGGIFNTAMLASGLLPNEIAQRWRTLKIKHFISPRKLRNYFSPLFMEGYADADNIRDKVFPHLGIDLNVIHQNQNINATFNVCNFSEKSIEAISHTSVQKDHLIAGVSLPIFMPALKIGQDWYTDAVWIKDAHLIEGVRQQSQELWLVWAIGNTGTYLPGAFNQYVHMIEMSAGGALLEEYNQIKLINKDIARGSDEYLQNEPIRLFVIKPSYPLPLDPDLFFNKVNARELINMGYEDAKSYLSKVNPSGEKMDREATKNKKPGDTLSFRAVFSGKGNWGQEYTEVIHYLHFRFFLSPEGPQRFAFSSVFISALNKEIPVYNHRIQFSKDQHSILLTIVGMLLIEGVEHRLACGIKMDSPLEIMMGIGLKKNTLTIRQKEEGETSLFHGDLFQSTHQRLKNCYFTRVKTAEGKGGGMGKRYQMFSKFIRDEI